MAQNSRTRSELARLVFADLGGQIISQPVSWLGGDNVGEGETGTHHLLHSDFGEDESLMYKTVQKLGGRFDDGDVRNGERVLLCEGFSLGCSVNGGVWRRCFALCRRVRTWFHVQHHLQRLLPERYLALKACREMSDQHPTFGPCAAGIVSTTHQSS
jgi:hypothetical protein